MHDKNIWRNIGGKNFCSFKMHARTETFCKNPNNVTGICDEFSCPLANSHYATVREEAGMLYLYIKVPERIHKPAEAYEKIELGCSYDAALQEIEERLQYWDEKLVHKCKQRLTKLTLYLRRKESMKKPEMRTLRKRQTRRERMGALKALGRVNFEKNIERELYERLDVGIYGVAAKDKFSRKSKVYEFEESDEDGQESRKPARKKTQKRAIRW